MAKKKYNKLVRDLIPEIIEQSGKKCKWHKARESSLPAYLAKKLVEEAKEFQENPSNEELADVMEVVRAIEKAMGLNRYAMMGLKAYSRGTFDKRIILDWVEE
jgi:predicted house-cleaning noncanonical NTP pyrophosphatase (MazG superfamily)